MHDPSIEAVPLKEILGISIPRLEIMDIGAMPEGSDRYSRLVDQGDAGVTGFEPNPEQFATLSARAGPYTYHPFFLGDGKPAAFHHARYPGCSSLLAPDPEAIDLFSTIGAAEPGGNFHVVRTEQVQTTRLDDVSACPPPDWIKIDVQGAELTVLRHGRQKLASALVVECEVEFVALYRDQPLFGDVQIFMRDCGFAFHRFVDVCGRCFRPFALQNPFLPMSQLLWSDAIFLRDFTKLERYSSDDLLKASTILHTIYHSYDLVSLLLREFDRRHAAGLNDRYQAHLVRMPLFPLFMNPKGNPY